MKPSPGTRAPRRLAAALLFALAAGCGGGSKPPLAPVDETPPGNLPPPIETVYPAARSTGVIYDTDIWVRFSEALDPASVNERTVFFKLDTVRYPVTLGYDAVSRTIRVVPRARLKLLRTYTVEITSGVRTASGHALMPGFWQFRTNGLRRLENPVPAQGTIDESPLAYLAWDETEPSAGAVSYKVYAGTDSAAVAARGIPISNVAVGSVIPSQSWGFSTRLYWTVTALNQTSNEQLDSPVWSFTTLPAGLPIDSVRVSATEWGQYDRTLNRMTCLGEFMFAGSRYNGGIHWPQREVAPGLKLARARIRMYGVAGNPLSGAPSIYLVKDPWASCSYTTFFPAAEVVKLADAFRIGLSPYIAFESEALTARVEAVGRGGPAYGFSLRASISVSFLSPTYGADGPLLTLYYYRVPPAPPAPTTARVP
jgi:hypothetical protein